MKTLLISILISVFFSINTSYAVQSGIITNKTLHQAAREGDIANVKLLISNGANPNKIVDGVTPLHPAAERGHKEVVQILLTNGANPNAKGNAGWTPLHLAATSGKQEVVALLIAKGSNVNALDENAKTPIWWANVKGHKQIVELLRRNGAKTNYPAQIQQGNVLLNTQEQKKTEAEQQTKPDIDLSSIADIDPLTEPNAVKQRLRKFQGLEDALKNVETQSQKVTTEWINGLEGVTTNIVKAVYEQIGAEYEFVRKQAAEENTNKTTAAIDGVILNRSLRFEKIAEKIQEEKTRRELLESLRGSRSRRSPRGRTGARDNGYNTGARDSGYNTGGGYQDNYSRSRSNRTRRSRLDMATKPSPPKVTITLPFTDPNKVKARIKTFEGMEKELKAIDRTGIREMRGWTTKQSSSSPMLAKAVYQQVKAELDFVRKLAIEENAAKTTVTIDGLIVSRYERYEKLAKTMLEEKRKLRRTSRTRTRR